MKDLFERYEELPQEVQDFIESNPDAFMDGQYEAVSNALIKMQELGYTFDYGLDGLPYDLRMTELETDQQRLLFIMSLGWGSLEYTDEVDAIRKKYHKYAQSDDNALNGLKMIQFFRDNNI